MSKTKDTKEDIAEELVDAATVEENAEVEALSVEDSLRQELGQEKDKFLRLFAEFENYKKRTSKERIELFKTASKDVMVSMLPIIDDFERAIMNIEDYKESEELRKGLEKI